jgi:CheY-like chemotaxis protein
MSAQTVREALEHLYANVELANTPLAQSGRFVAPTASVVQRAQAIRNVLLDAIESLRPVRSLLPHQTGAGRSYEVLSLRYVSSLTIDEIGDRLAVGSRQIYRDLRRAEEELTALLEAQGTPVSDLAISAGSTPVTAFQAELDALTRHQDVVELGELLHSAVRMVQALADHKEVMLHYQRPQQPVPVTATPSIAKEMLIQLLSALVQQSGPGQLLTIHTRQARPESDAGRQPATPDTAPEYVEVVIRGDGGSVNGGESGGFAWENPLLQNALLMAQLLEMTSVVRPEGERAGGSRSGEIRAGENREVILRFNALPESVGSKPVLIVEDNPGVSELYQRYLQGTPWRPELLANPAETIAKAQELRPAAIILDVLMPETDGWSVLQTLRATPELATIPVIICSVINDPELAAALGAAASLKKPLSRLELMEALHGATVGARG